MLREKVSIVLSLDMETAWFLDQEGYVLHYNTASSLSDDFVAIVQENMGKYLGNEEGFVLGLALLNGESVALRNLERNNSPFRISDVLPVSPGEVLIEFKLNADSLLTVGLNRLLDLRKLAEEFGAEHPVVSEELTSSLKVGLDLDEDNVLCFLPYVLRENVSSYVFIDEEFRPNYKGIFKGIEPSKINNLDVF